MAKKETRVSQEYIINLQGKDFVLYAGLLDLAHQEGLTSLAVQIIQFPSEENKNTCICQATAVLHGNTPEQIVVTDIGDANPANTGKAVAAHLIRMASSRSKARALRDITNVGITAFEEMDVDVTPASSPASAPRKEDAFSSINPSEPVTAEQLSLIRSAEAALGSLGATVIARDITNQIEGKGILEYYRSRYTDIATRKRRNESIPTELLAV